MGIDEKMTEILDFILNRASKFELEMVGEALRKRMERETSLGLGQIDVHGMARTMAADIEKQMGVGAGSVHEMSRRLVADMILKEQPDISKRDLDHLLDQWVPGGAPKKQAGIPKDVLLTMITQFVAFSTGEMSDDEKKQFPEGWYKKYWEAFPPEVQMLIRDFIQGKTGQSNLWKGIREYLSAIK